MRNCTVAVIGLGYVGLPTALALHKAGFEVYGVDISEWRVGQSKEIAKLNKVEANFIVSDLFDKIKSQYDLKHDIRYLMP